MWVFTVPSSLLGSPSAPRRIIPAPSVPVRMPHCRTAATSGPKSRGLLGTHELPPRSLDTWLIREPCERLMGQLLLFPLCLRVGPRSKDTPNTIATISHCNRLESLASVRSILMHQPGLNAALPRLCRVRHVTIASLSYATCDHRELTPPHGLETPNGNGVR